MEFCNQRFWSENFESFQPHYSEVLNAPETAEVDTLMVWKSALCTYIIVVAFFLRLSFFISLVLVTVLGSPFFAVHYYLAKKNQEEANGEKQAAKKAKSIQESAQKLQGMIEFEVQAPSLSSQRRNQVASEPIDQEGVSEMIDEEAVDEEARNDPRLQNRESIMPIVHQNSE